MRNIKIRTTTRDVALKIQNLPWRSIRKIYLLVSQNPDCDVKTIKNLFVRDWKKVGRYCSEYWKQRGWNELETEETTMFGWFLMR